MEELVNFIAFTLLNGVLAIRVHWPFNKKAQQKISANK